MRDTKWLRVKMTQFEMTKREYEFDLWIDNDDDEYESNFYDELEFEDV